MAAAKSIFVALFTCAALAACAKVAAEGDQSCSTRSYGDQPYVVCTVDMTRHDIRLFYADADDEPYLDFRRLADALAETEETLLFAMNGGMYHEDRSPVGLYIDGDGQRARLNTNDGPGNFHMLPNGVFGMDGDSAFVMETAVFAETFEDADPDYATQSGPMLVINGDIHPSINPDGTSKKRRNGVGVDLDGRTVHFVISDVPVTFHQFASVFRDELDAPNALFLDGVVSRVYAVELDRDEQGLDMGPMVGVVQ
ncbi:MAG: phosphodiester glycosidase family protein [Pseudomonadota bacterium]